MRTRSIVCIIGLVLTLVQVPSDCVYGQEKKIPDGTDGVYFKEDSLTGEPKKDPNEVVKRKSTFKIGLGYIHDFTAYDQNDVFKRQMDSLGLDLKPTSQPRDFRVLGSFRIRTKRTLAFKFAFMWNGDTKDWLIRETGFTIGVPELGGHIFIGRTKEGFSMVKVMNGHSPWGYERQMALDVIPILADGIKWFGFLPTSRIFWNVGYYNDFISEGQSFSTFEWQYIARVGWMPFYDKENAKLLHIAANVRYAKPLDGNMTLKSRPESNPTPHLINTGKFQSDHSSHIGGEVYYSKERFMIGSEFMFHSFYSDDLEDHKFFGGNIVLSYFLTGAVRPYNTIGSIYGFVPVRKSVFKGGWGEWEAVLTATTLNLNSGSIHGGKMWRITPMINWYLSKAIRMEFIYGYVGLDRFELKGRSQFFESRIQFTVM
jgi:phosphate-selective porin OprO/OprP